MSHTKKRTCIVPECGNVFVGDTLVCESCINGLLDDDAEALMEQVREEEGSKRD